MNDKIMDSNDGLELKHFLFYFRNKFLFRRKAEKRIDCFLTSFNSTLEDEDSNDKTAYSVYRK